MYSAQQPIEEDDQETDQPTDAMDVTVAQGGGAADCCCVL